MTTFKVPKQKAKSIQTVSEFLGADFTNSPANIDMRRSPNCKNMIRDVPGKVRKSMGWEVIKDYGEDAGKVNGVHIFRGDTGATEGGDTPTPIDPADYAIGMKFKIAHRETPLTKESLKEYIAEYVEKENELIALRGWSFPIQDAFIDDYVERVWKAEYANCPLGITLSVVQSGFSMYMNADLYYITADLDVEREITNVLRVNQTKKKSVTVYSTIPSVIESFALKTIYNLDTSSRTYIYSSVSQDTSGLIYGFADLTNYNDNAAISKQIDTGIVESDGSSAGTSGTSGSSTSGKNYKLGFVVHIGEKLYYNNEVIYDGMNDARSKSWQFGDVLYIMDGKKLLAYTKTTDASGTVTHTVKAASQDAYIPTLTISKNPEGGGTPYESLNLLQPGFTEMFLGKANVVEYALSFKDLDATTVRVQILNSNGEWVNKTENTDFTVNRTTGVVTFTTAPGVSPVTGEDNVKITAYKTVDGYADRINKCNIGTLYGIGGAQDRLFLSGNPDYPNYDWFSEQFNPQYFADTSYSRLGSDRGAIIGYSVVNNYLATHKDDMEASQNIVMRTGTTVNDEIAFKVVNTVQGPGAISKDSFAYLGTEPLFLTKQGVYAVTSQDVTGEKYAQNRSYFLNGKMLKEDNLENAYACVYNDMYWLCINDVCYILDGLQATMTDKSMPYSTRQYCGFYRTNVPANIMWAFDNRLWFGTSDGKICRFHNDSTRLMNYNDDGEAIEAIWETPDLDGQLFFKNKTLRYLAVRVESAIATSMTIYAMNRGLWELVKEDNTFSRYFSYENFMYSKLSFSCDATQRISRTKMRIKKVDKYRLKFVNNKVNEPLGLYDIGLEMVENGNFKG